jgi:septal ring factor EnvC (AmiA/AmiB activator)
MSNSTSGDPTITTSVKLTSLDQLQAEMAELLKELSTVHDMVPVERQRLQLRFELKSLEIKIRIVQAEHDDVVEELPRCRQDVDDANAAVKAAQDRYRDALNLFTAMDDRRKRLAMEVDGIQRECEAVRLRIP